MMSWAMLKIFLSSIVLMSSMFDVGPIIHRSNQYRSFGTSLLTVSSFRSLTLRGLVEIPLHSLISCLMILAASKMQFRALASSEITCLFEVCNSNTAKVMTSYLNRRAQVFSCQIVGEKQCHRQNDFAFLALIYALCNYLHRCL